MSADAIQWIAVGLLPVVGYVVVRAIELAQVALRDGGEVEFEVKAPSLSLRFRAGRPRSTFNHVHDGASTNSAQSGTEIAGAETKSPRSLEK